MLMGHVVLYIGNSCLFTIDHQIPIDFNIFLWASSHDVIRQSKYSHSHTSCLLQYYNKCKICTFTYISTRTVGTLLLVLSSTTILNSFISFGSLSSSVGTGLY